MLYRLCNLYDAFNPYESKFALLCSTSFLYSEENKGIINHFLSRFRVDGNVFNDFSKNIYSRRDFAFLICSPLSNNDMVQDTIELSRAYILEDGSMEEKGKPISYTFSNESFLGILKSKYKDLMTDKVLGENENGVIEGNLEVLVKGNKNALGYLNYGDKVFLTSNPYVYHDGNVKCIPITRSNLLEIVAYYGVLKSRQCCSVSSSINFLVEGNPKYKEVVFNCLPLFLFDVDSRFRDYGTVKFNGEVVRMQNYFNPLKSDILKPVLEKAELNYTFEAKEVYYKCISCLDYVVEKQPEFLVGSSFNELRKGINDTQIVEGYMAKLDDLKHYINSISKEIE